jgi:hypothetical protein
LLWIQIIRRLFVAVFGCAEAAGIAWDAVDREKLEVG